MVLLALLAERPQHGYELMAELEERFGAEYQPSPGSIYPALVALEAENLIRPFDEGDRRIYQPTPAGLEALTDRRHLLARIETRTGARLGASGAAEGTLQRLLVKARELASTLDPEAVARILEEAEQKLQELARKEANR